MFTTAISATPSACTPRLAGQSTAGRGKVVVVRAIFGRNNKDAERKKEEEWLAQQELLAERRAKRDRLMQTFGRMEAKSSGRAAQKVEPAAPSPSPKRAAREEVQVIEEEEESAPKAAGGNPLAGLLGGLFGKK